MKKKPDTFRDKAPVGAGGTLYEEPTRRGIASMIVVMVLAIGAAFSLLTLAPAALADSVGTQINAGARLNPGDWIESPNRAYRLVMQPDGNLVEYGPSGALWATYTSAGGTYLVNQPDGNLVMYRPDGGVAWASRTNGQGATTLVVQDDGNVVAYGANPTWATYTAGGVSKMAASGAVAFARNQLGKSYVWGGTGPDAYDCSGLTMKAYASVGITLNRTSQQQYQQGSAISREALQPGDLVFYNGSLPTHVGIYVGNNEIISALNRKSGVRYNNINDPGSITGYRRLA
jgi:cell wall-associated NlpC family hydrolase